MKGVTWWIGLFRFELVVSCVVHSQPSHLLNLLLNIASHFLRNQKIANKYTKLAHSALITPANISLSSKPESTKPHWHIEVPGSSTSRKLNQKKYCANGRSQITVFMFFFCLLVIICQNVTFLTREKIIEGLNFFLS